MSGRSAQRGVGSDKGFRAAGRRLDAPPAGLVKALRELGDTESANRLVEAYPARARRAKDLTDTSKG